MNRTRKLLCIVGFGMASALAVGPAVAQAPDKNEQAAPKTKAHDQSKSMAMIEKKSTEATVERVDMAKRRLLLKDENGKELTVEVPQSVKRLNEIKPGDKIKVDYYESIALSLKKAGEGAEAGSKTMIERSAGKLPSGMILKEQTGVVEIQSVDAAKNELTVKRPDGKLDTIHVTNPDLQSQLANLHEGDKIQVSYTQAAAITVERAGAQTPESSEKGGMQKEQQPKSQQPMNENKPETKSM